MKYLIKKILITARDFKKTSRHHYGNHFTSYFKLIYYSLFKINTFYVFVNDLEGFHNKEKIPPEYAFIIDGASILDSIRTSRDLPREFYADKTYDLKYCMLLMDGDEIAYLQWNIFKGEHSRFFCLSENVVEFNYMVTMPNYRGRSIAKIMISSILDYYKNNGYKKAVAAIHSENLPAIKAYEKSGFKIVGNIKSYGQFNKKVHI